MARNTSRTLILNADYRPVAVVNLRRALVLVLLKRAEIVTADGSYSHAERIMMDNPSVIRLREFKNIPYTRKVPVTRRNVLVRDGHVCGYCGGVGTTIDHIIPRAQGGQHVWKNVVSACRSCNSRKAARTPAEAGMRLRIDPHEPHGTGALLVLVGEVKEDWVPWLSDREVASA